MNSVQYWLYRNKRKKQEGTKEQGNWLMETQCPKCHNIQNVPKEYKGRDIKCLACKQSFTAIEFKEDISYQPEPKLEPKSESPTEAIKCPECGSTQIMGDKKGYSGGKAIGGAVLLGPLGLLAGLHGSKKVTVTCLNCGKQWEPGKS